jgi:hypothetical protein
MLGWRLDVRMNGRMDERLDARVDGRLGANKNMMWYKYNIFIIN